jgi:hypothetical protein
LGPSAGLSDNGHNFTQKEVETKISLKLYGNGNIVFEYKISVMLSIKKPQCGG